MAGYQDQLVGPAPYVETIPVDAYTRVGMIKQQQYDQGVQKVQSYIDSVAGLDVVHPEQKDYLNQRIGQLQSKVQQIASQDFSQQQIVNSVGHLTNEIASDPIVQNAVYSTAAYRQENTKMKTAQEAGKSSPANEFVYQRQVQNWLGNHDARSAFNAQYNPYVDYKGKMLKALNEGVFGKGREDEYLTEMPYKRGNNGQVLVDDHGQPIINYAMMQETYKGVSAERIRNVVDSSLDENDKRQIAIDGQYEYRGLQKPELKNLTDRSYQSNLDKINSAIQGLTIERSKNINDKNHIDEVDQKINSLKKQATDLGNSYLRDIGSIDTDPEGYKSNLYNQQWLSKFSEGYSYSQHSLKFVDNPFFKAAQQERENNIKFMEFQETRQFHYDQLRQQSDIEDKKLQVELYKAGLKSKLGKGAKGDGSDITLSDLSLPEAIPSELNPQNTEETFLNNIKTQQDAVDTQKMALLSSKRPDLVKTTFDSEGKNPHYEWNVKGLPVQQANAIITEGEASIKSLKDGYDKGQTDPATKKYFDNVAVTDQNVKNAQATVRYAQESLERDHPELTLKPQLSRVTPLQITSGSGTHYNISAEKMLLFNQKMEKVHKQTGVIGGGGLGLGNTNTDYYDDAEAARQFTSPEEKLLYAIAKKPEDQRNQGDKFIINKLSSVYENVNAPSAGVIAKRNTYIGNVLQHVTGVKEPVSTELTQFKGEDKAAAHTFANQVYTSVAGADKSNPNPAYDKDLIATMLNAKNAPNTTYSLVDRGNGDYSLRYSNTSVSEDKFPEINLTRVQAGNIFNGQIGLDTFEAIGNAINLSKLQGRWTTNVQGQGVETALNLNNGQLNNYKVKYDVEDLNKDGTYQIRAYIHDIASNGDKEVVLNPGFTMSKEQVMIALAAVNDDTIKTALESTK